MKQLNDNKNSLHVIQPDRVQIEFRLSIIKKITIYIHSLYLTTHTLYLEN